MESSEAASDGDTSVFCSPEAGPVEPAETQKFKISVSVSSLAEIFEKGRESIKSEDKEVAEGESVTERDSENILVQMDASGTDGVKVEGFAEGALQHSAEPKVDGSCVEGKNSVSSQDAAKLSETANEPCHAEGKENIAQIQLPQLKRDIDSAVQAVKTTTNSNIDEPSTSVTDVETDAQAISGVLSTDPQISSAVKERVVYLAGKLARSSENSDASISAKEQDLNANPGEGAKVSSTSEPNTKNSEITRKISLKDLETSFVNALNLVNSYASNIQKSADALPVPSIQITEASDQEEASLDAAEPVKSATGDKKAETPVSKNTVESDAKPSNVEEPTPCCSRDVQLENKDEIEVEEERKAFFYISSSDLPGEPIDEPVDYPDELKDRAALLEHRVEAAARLQQSDERKSSCLCSKSFHGAVFLASAVVGLLGYILYNFALKGKVPDFCEHLGMVTAIIAVVTGAVSCFCFSILEAIPRLPDMGYQRLADADDIRCRNRNVKPQNLDEESWSSETERAFRRQNGMSSTRTSEESLRQSDYREMVEKTEKVKKEVTSLLDSFSEMLNKLKPSDEVAQMELGEASEK